MNGTETINEPSIRLADPQDLEHNVMVQLIDVDGTVLRTSRIHNVVTTVGKANIANFMGGLASQTAWTKAAIGTGNTVPAAGQTALASETAASGMARKTADTISVSTSTLILDSTWTNTSGGTVTIEEHGVFNTSVTPIMLARSLTNTHAVGNGQSLRIVHSIPVA